jgi:TPR repeat protein
MVRRTLAAMVIGLSLLMGAGSAWAADRQKGAEAYQKGDYATALREWRPLAEQGNVNAQAILGYMYVFGQGVVEDDKEAVRWYRLAADQGHAKAQANLGYMYDFGQGVVEDDKEAVRWYRLAADQGHAKAQANLGNMYRFGKGVVEDHKVAVLWYRLAADQGHAKAQDSLGRVEKTLRSEATDAYVADCQFRNIEKVVSDAAGKIVQRYCQDRANKHIEGKTLDWLLRQ